MKDKKLETLLERFSKELANKPSGKEIRNYRIAVKRHRKDPKKFPNLPKPLREWWYEKQETL